MTPSDDRIELRGLHVSARCGVLPEERDRAQPLEIDLDLQLDLRPAGQSDDLTETVDYGAVCDLVARVCAAGAPRLLEHLAEQIAEELLASTTADEVVVAVRKLRPPVPQQLATSGVRIRRDRSGVDR